MEAGGKAAEDALVGQFELASKLTERLGEVSTALQQTSELGKQMEAREKEASGNAEVQQALEEMEKKIEVAKEPGSDDDFMLFGISMPSKEHEPLPEVAAALSLLLT